MKSPWVWFRRDSRLGMEPDQEDQPTGLQLEERDPASSAVGEGQKSPAVPQPAVGLPAPPHSDDLLLGSTAEIQAPEGAMVSTQAPLPDTVTRPDPSAAGQKRSRSQVHACEAFTLCHSFLRTRPVCVLQMAAPQACELPAVTL